MAIHAEQSIATLEWDPTVIHEGQLTAIHAEQSIATLEWDPTLIHEGQLTAILERYPTVIHEGQLTAIHEGQPSRPILLPRDMARIELFHLTKLR